MENRLDLSWDLTRLVMSPNEDPKQNKIQVIDMTVYCFYKSRLGSLYMTGFLKEVHMKKKLITLAIVIGILSTM